MQEGDEVMIYYNPRLYQVAEGFAVLRKLLRADEGDGLSSWLVEYIDEPGALYDRVVYDPEAADA
jgi:hypothetical protein